MTTEEAGRPANDEERRVVITGISGTLGQSLGAWYRSDGAKVVGVTHRSGATPRHCDELVVCTQEDLEDARALVAADPDVLILNAGRIETEVGPGGRPLPEATAEIYRLNAVFPSLVALAAAELPRRRRLDLVAIGSIADGSPSCFGPVYHASKAALHQFVAGTAPILHAAHPWLRLRLYRPGVIQGPLSWAPVLRLNERGRAIRAARCKKAPEADVVADRIARWIAGDDWIGGDREPFSFRALKHFFGLAPDLYARLQHLAWRRGSAFTHDAKGEARVFSKRTHFSSSEGARRTSSSHGG